MVWDNWMSLYKRMKWNLYLTLYIKINSKCIKGLNITLKTREIVKENIKVHLYDFEYTIDTYDT